jgi:hypothetical protein
VDEGQQGDAGQAGADRVDTAAPLSPRYGGGFAVFGSASRSAVAEGAGGRSPMVSPVAAALVLFTEAPSTRRVTDAGNALSDGWGRRDLRARLPGHGRGDLLESRCVLEHPAR